MEQEWSGVNRLRDFTFWAGQPEAELFVVRDGGAVAAVGASRVRQARPVRVLDRLVVNPDRAIDPVPVTLAAIRHAGRGGLALSAIQGPNPVLRPLLDLGFRVMDRDQFMASDPEIVDPARIIPNAGML
jgi:hypothetical protein